MLRITVHEEPERIVLQLEGRLAGCWVQELQDCLQNARVNSPHSRLQLDLNEVTYVDSCGKIFLKAAHETGVELVASGCWMRAILAELTNRSISIIE